VGGSGGAPPDPPIAVTLGAEPTAGPVELAEAPVVNIASSPDEGSSSRTKGAPFVREIFPELEEVIPSGPRWATPTEDILRQPYIPGINPCSFLLLFIYTFFFFNVLFLCFDPDWGVRVGDRLHSSRVSRRIIDHVATPVTSVEFQEFPDEEVMGELAQGLAFTTALASEGLYRWEDQARMAAAHKKHADTWKERVAIRDAELDLLEGKHAALEREVIILRERAALVGRTEQLERENEELRKKMEQVQTDNRWLVSDGVKEFSSILHQSSEFLRPQSQRVESARAAGYTEGVQEGYMAARQKIPLSRVRAYDPSAPTKFAELMAEDPSEDYPYLNALSALAGESIETLRGVRPASPSLD
jgi:hypothetical protein